MSRPLRFALIGAGGIAQTWAQAFLAAAGSVSLEVVCDVRRDAAEGLAEATGARVSPDALALAADGAVDIDAVVICTPPTTHREIACAFAAAGRHVLCEKPLAIDAGDASVMVETAAQHGVVLTMASKFRFVEDVVKARSMLTSGLLGEPVLLSNAFTSAIDMRQRWNADRPTSGGGVVIDNGTHSVDIARYLLGPLAGVMASAPSPAPGYEVEDTARMELRSAAGALGAVTLSWSVNAFADTYVEVVGTEGVVEVGWAGSRHRKATSPQWTEFGSGYDKVEAHARQLEVFAAAVRGEGDLLIGPDDALASVHAVEAAYRSLAGGRWVDLPTVAT